MREITYTMKQNTAVVRLIDKAIFLTVQGRTFHAYYPVRIEDVDQVLIDLMMWILFYGMGENEADGSYEKPYLSGPRKDNTNEGVLLSHSGGVDSTATLLLSPLPTRPAYIYRDYQELYGLNQQAILTQAGALRIYTDFERVRELYLEKHGFNVGVGYAAMMFPLLDAVGAKYITMGGIFDDMAFYYGTPFRYNGDAKHGRYDFMRDTLRTLGIHLNLPTIGMSEAVATRLVAESEYRDTVCSCHVKEMQGNYCRSCYKCFRKLPVRGERIDLDNPRIRFIIMRHLRTKPLKMASSIIYGIQKAGGYGIKAFDRYMDIDVSFLDRYDDGLTRRYCSPEMYAMMVQKFKDVGIEPQTGEDAERIKRFVNIINDDVLYDPEGLE